MLEGAGRFAAVLARPLGLRADEADAGAVGVVVDLPRGGEEHLDVVGREEIGRAVRAVEHADLPVVGVGRAAGLRSALRRAPARRRRDAARRRRAARGRRGRRTCPRMKVLRLPRYSRHVDAAAIARYARRPRLARVPSSSSAPGCTATACQRGTGAPSSRASKSAPVSAIVGVAGEAQRRAHDRDLEARGGLRIAHQPIGQRGRPARPSDRMAARRRASSRAARDNPARWSACRHRSRRWRGGGSRSRAGTRW